MGKKTNRFDATRRWPETILGSACKQAPASYFESPPGSQLVRIRVTRCKQPGGLFTPTCWRPKQGEMKRTCERAFRLCDVTRCKQPGGLFTPTCWRPKQGEMKRTCERAFRLCDGAGGGQINSPKSQNGFPHFLRKSLRPKKSGACARKQKSPPAILQKCKCGRVTSRGKSDFHC